VKSRTQNEVSQDVGELGTCIALERAKVTCFKSDSSEGINNKIAQNCSQFSGRDSNRWPPEWQSVPSQCTELLDQDHMRGKLEQ
jgi:hypothetical protein